MSGNHRWSKFWWDDWLADPALRSCSLAAQGLWMVLLCIAHKGTPRGYVTLNERPATTPQIAAIAGTTRLQCERLIGELEAAGVFSRGENFEIFSRRMVRETEQSERGRQFGALGGNTALSPQSSPSDEDPKTPKGDNPPPTPPRSRSRSKSTEAEKNTPHTPQPTTAALPLLAGAADATPVRPKPPGRDDAPGFDLWWSFYPRKEAKQAARKAYARALRSSPDVTPETLLRGLKAYPFDNREGTRFIPHPTTWLNQGRWEGAEDLAAAQADQGADGWARLLRQTKPAAGLTIEGAHFPPGDDEDAPPETSTQ